VSGLITFGSHGSHGSASNLIVHSHARITTIWPGVRVEGQRDIRLGSSPLTPRPFGFWVLGFLVPGSGVPALALSGVLVGRCAAVEAGKEPEAVAMGEGGEGGGGRTSRKVSLGRVA